MKLLKDIFKISVVSKVIAGLTKERRLGASHFTVAGLKTSRAVIQSVANAALVTKLKENRAILQATYPKRQPTFGTTLAFRQMLPGLSVGNGQKRSFTTQNINIVFDIDDSIATGFYDDDFSKLEKRHSWVSIFKNKGLYLDAIKPHIIHPGVIELIQLLDKMPNMRMSFFSGGAKERNQILVEKLLCLALGQKRYNSIQNKIKICSRTDLEVSISTLDKSQHESYGIDHGNNKKNLKKILGENDDLDWTVLIEDDLTYTYYGQEKNILKIPSAWDIHFSQMYQGLTETQKFSWETFSRVNHIFYACGIICSALEITKQEQNKSLSDILFQMQFKENMDERSYSKMIFNRELCNNINYYEIGLKKLKEINPNLYFLHPGKEDCNPKLPKFF